MNKLIIASNMLNEVDQIKEWHDNMSMISDGILVVDGGSTDGTIEFLKKQNNVKLIIDDIIQREGYGPARNHLREMCRTHYFDAHWCLYLDGDERIAGDDFHQLRFLKDYLVPQYDVVALPRLNMLDTDSNKTKNDININPDWQARMTRLGSSVMYFRKLHEQLKDHRAIYTEITNPKIRHYHRSTGQKKRDFIGKLCSKLHMEDEEYGSTYPEHHKEAYYREMLEKEGLE